MTAHAKGVHRVAGATETCTIARVGETCIAARTKEFLRSRVEDQCDRVCKGDLCGRGPRCKEDQYGHANGIRVGCKVVRVGLVGLLVHAEPGRSRVPLRSLWCNQRK
ncbi:hypothetical protein LOAG_13265 [Loa loa]|uniref:Uncharacterized protein n=1 Tax=Loa loa TaxID=7209 RepID=A0A1S0TKT1_LOALO|nr:hypothetical protein LOAG_13265 [Loa loa]EFO15249.1 hypothetical protein LOAG_13265 [Loa loa]